TPQGRRGHTSTSATGAFLAPGLLGGVLDDGAVLLGAGALAGVGLISHDHLVHQGFVVFAAEHGVRGVDLGRGLTLFIQELELHQLAPFLTLTLIAGRTVTKPPFEPGTAPRTSSN